MKPFWLTSLLAITFILGEVVEIPNLALYHVTPKHDAHMRYLNKLRTSDSGMMFINGIGGVGETVEVLAPPSVLEIFGKELNDMKIHFDMEFSPVTMEMLNKNFTEKKPLPPVTSLDELKAATEQAVDLLPIEAMAIPDVFSGVFLKIFSANKNLEVDELTFGGKINSTMGNPYVCLRVNKQGDESDGPKQWIFEKSERQGYYVLRNRKLTTGYVTWEDDEEKYLVIETRREFQRLYRKGGPLRKNVLFKVTREQIPTKNITPERNTTTTAKNVTATALANPSLYKIGIRGMDDEDTHIVTDAVWVESTGCYLLRRTSRDTSYDGDKMEHFFRIEKASTSLKIVGLIDDFRYKEKLDDLYQRAQDQKTVKPLTRRHVFNHGPHPMKFFIEDAHERRDRFHLKFRDNTTMNVFQEVWVTPGLNIGSTMSKNNSGKQSMVKLSPSARDTVEKFKYQITGALEIPPWSSMTYTIMFGWLEKLNIPFNATLKIIGKGDRMTFSENPKVVVDQLLTFGYVYESLLQRGFKFDHKPYDPLMMWHKVPIKGSVIAKTLGIRGDVEMTIKTLTQDISTTCKHPPNNEQID